MSMSLFMTTVTSWVASHSAYFHSKALLSSWGAGYKLQAQKGPIQAAAASPAPPSQGFSYLIKAFHVSNAAGILFATSLVRNAV